MSSSADALPAKFQYYIAQVRIDTIGLSDQDEGILDKELGKYPAIVNLEKTTQVPKAYMALGSGLFVSILILFNVWGSLLTNLIGFVYPAYQSFKAIESLDKNDDTLWLTYWTVYGFLNLLEFFTDIVLYWVPFYFTIKAVFILWLMLPQFRGAHTLYVMFLRPVLLRESGRVDGAFSKLKEGASAAVKEFEKETKNE